MTEGGNDGWAGMAAWRERRTGGNGPALPAHGYRMWASPSVFVANQFVIPAKAGIQRPLRQEGWHWTDSPGFPLPDGGRGRASGERCKAQWIPAFAGMTGGRGWRMAGTTGGGTRWAGMTEGGHDGWAGMADWRERRGAGTTDWWERRKVGMTGGGNGPALPAHGYRMWASPSVFVANQLVISATLVAPAAPRHSRENGNPEAYATGRLALDGQPWIPAPRWGSGTSFGGTMQGAVDSRFRGNDRWVGMTDWRA